MTINFKKNPDGLIPAIIQDSETRVVLMLGYMNEEAYQQTISSGRVTFFSRSRNRLWVKGEESGNFLNLEEIKIDCDNDTLLIKVIPEGPVCHKGTDTCWNEKNTVSFGFLSELQTVIGNRKVSTDTGKSYITTLFGKGINKIAQKVGEEAIEMVIESKDTNDDLFLNEGADLLFHYLILLQAKGFCLEDITEVLQSRAR